MSVTQAFQQVAAGTLLAARHLRHPGKAEDDAVRERVHQRCGDLIGHRGQVVGAGGARGVDQSLQCLGDLDGPVRIRVELGGVSKIAQQMAVMPISA